MGRPVKMTVDDLVVLFPRLKKYGQNTAETALSVLYEKFESGGSLVTDCVSLDKIYPERGHPTQRVYVLGGKIVSSRIEQLIFCEGLEVRMESEHGKAGELMALFSIYVQSHSWRHLKRLINKASDVKIV